jgi:PAS domain S-box-containing protein
MVYTPFIWPLVIAILINGGLAIYARRFRGAPAARSFSLLMVLGSLTALVYALEISAASLPLRIFWSELRFIPLAPVAPALLVFVLEYLGQGNRLTWPRLVLLFLIPAITIVLSLTSPYHQLFRHHFYLDESGAVSVLLFSRGIWWFIYFLYSMVLEFLACGLLLGSFRMRALRYRNTLVITFGLLFTISIDLLYNLRLTPFPGYYWTPSMFALTGALFGWAVLRGRMLNVAPVAREAVIENMDDLVIVLDTQNHIVDFNPAAQAVCGLSPQAIGAAPAEALPAPWAELFLRIGDQKSAGKQEVSIAENGETGMAVYELTISPVIDQRQRRLGCLFLLNNITERKHRERQLAFQADLLANVNDAIVASDENYKLTAWNAAAERLYGWKAGEVLGRNGLEIISTDFSGADAEKMRAQIAESGQWRGEATQRRKEGSRFPVEVSSLVLHDLTGKISGYVSVNHDITRRKQMEQALRASEERFRSLFEHMLDGYAYCRMLYQDQKPIDFVYLEVNRAFEELTGLKNVRGRKVSEVIPGIQESNSELFDVYSRVALTGEPERFETQIEALDIWLSISVYSTGKEYFVAVFENITGRKRAEEQIKKALDEKEILLKEIHHRVKNNLTIVSSLLELQARASQDERLKSAFQNSQQRIQAMTAIHEQLYRSDNLARIDMAKYIAALAEDLRSAYARTEVALQVDVKNVYLGIDQAIPCGLLLNELLTNALKYAFTAGPDRQAGSSALLESQIIVSMHPEDGRYILLVRDNGCGLPGEFDVQTARSLGLKLVNRLAGQLHGELEVTSVAGSGTSFTITFLVQA